MSNKRNASTTIGMSIDQETCLIHGQVSLNFTLLEEKPPNGYMWSGQRLTRRKQLTSRPDHFVARTLEEDGRECHAEGEAKVVE